MIGLAVLLGILALGMSYTLLGRFPVLRTAGGEAAGMPEGGTAVARLDTQIEPDLEERVTSIMRTLSGAGGGDAPQEPEDALPVIDSFDAARDVIVVELPGHLADVAEIEVRADGTGSIVSIGGTDIARVLGAIPSPEEAVRLVVVD